MCNIIWNAVARIAEFIYDEAIGQIANGYMESVAHTLKECLGTTTDDDRTLEITYRKGQDNVSENARNRLNDTHMSQEQSPRKCLVFLSNGRRSDQWCLLQHQQ